MAIPTFTSVSSIAGPTAGGELVTITGTNFKVPVSSFVIPQPSAVRSVEVLFDGIAAKYVDVVSATTLRVRTPQARLEPTDDLAIFDPNVARVNFPAVAITIRNQDASGDPIAGEEVIAAAAYAYQQPLHITGGGTPPLLQVHFEVLRKFIREVMSNVSGHTHTDFGVAKSGLEPISAATNISLLARVPAFGLRLSIMDDPDYNYLDNEPTVVPDGAGAFAEYRTKKTVAMQYSIRIRTKDQFEGMAVMSTLILLQEASPLVEVQPDSRHVGDLGDWQVDNGEPRTGVNRYPLEEVSPPVEANSDNADNTRIYTAVYQVRGVQLVGGDAESIAIKAITNIEVAFGRAPSDSSPVPIVV